MPYLRATPVAAAEGAAFIEFTITLDQASGNEIKVNYDTVNGIANYNSSAPDFQRNYGTLSFAAGETSKTVRVNLVNNTTQEGTELFWLDLNTPVNASVEQRYTPALIFDNDGTAGTPAISVSDAVVDETARTASFFVWLSRPATGTVSVSYASADDTAQAGSDYRSVAGTLSFAPGEVVKTVTVDILDDSLAEADEFLQLRLSSPANATLLDGLGVATIAANDAAPVGAPYVSAHPIATDEAQPSASFVVQLSAPSGNQVSVNYDLVNGTANYNSSAPDFQRHYGTLVFAPGETAKVVTVPVVANTTLEGNALFWLDLNAPVNAIVEQRYTPALMIDNDGIAGTPGLQLSEPVVDESAGTARFFVWLNRPSANVVTVNYATADDSATAGSDYRAASGSLSFAPGEMVKTVTVDVSDDTQAEGDEFFRLQLSGPVNATLIDSQGVAQIGRNDGDAIGAPYVTARPLAIDEAQMAAYFVVQLGAPSSNQVSVNYDLVNGTANYNSSAPDFQRNYGTLVFAPGETTRVVTAPIVDNTTVETNAMFWLELDTPVNAIVEQRYTPIMMIDNDAVAGTPGLQVSEPVVDESTGQASFFVWLNRPSVNVVTVAYATADGTAQAGSDYRAASGTLSFAPGEMVKTVLVDIVDDTVPEVDEAFRLQLSNPANATLIDSGAQALIGRNDAPPAGAPYVTAQPVATDEAQPLTQFVVKLSAPSGNQVSVNYDLVNATANYNSSAPDFQRNYGTLVFAPGETTKLVTAPVVDNTTAEANAMFWLDLNAPVNAVVEQRYTPALMIDNDGIAGTPGLLVSDTVVDETSGRASFFVQLDKPSANVVTVAWRTADVSAHAGSDYRAASGTLSFAPGEMVKTVGVDIFDDALAEGNEAFQVLLSSPVNATLVDGTGAALIGRNDGPLVSQPQVLSSPVTASEDDVAAYFVVQLSAPSGNEVRVNYDFANGTANYNSSAPDFQRHYGTLVFAPGETTKLLTAPLVISNSAEGSETFSLELSSPVNATVPQRSTGATILDPDSGFKVWSYGLGDDLYTVTSAQDRIAESPLGGIDTVRASVSYTLPDNVENLVLTGSALNGIGNAGNNVFRGTAANNSFDGQAGIDTAVFSGPRAAYTLGGNTTQRTVSGGADGSDTLYSVERLQFADTILASDTAPGGHVYQAYALFNAAFDRAPSTAELSQWTATLDRLGSLEDTAAEFINTYAPGVPDEVLVAYLWSTVIGGAVPADALALYSGLLANGSYTQGALFALASTLDFNTVEIAGIAGQTLALDPAFFAVPA